MATSAAAARKWPQAFGPYQRMSELGLLICNIALFIVCVADWLGWLPGARGFQPLRMVYFSGALVLQAVGSVISRRSTAAHLVLVAASIVLLMFSALVIGDRTPANPRHTLGKVAASSSFLSTVTDAEAL